MAKKIAQMIEEQLQFWKIQHPDNTGAKNRNQKLPVITISREYGAKGAVLATKLGERLGFKVWDKEILDIISERLDSSSEYLSALDENTRNMLEDTIFGFMNQKGTNLNYQIYLVKAIRAIEDQGSSIIVGRAANFICRNPRSLHIRVVCPIEERVKRYAVIHEIPTKQARVLVQQKDLERENFTLFNFNRDLEQASHYDLVINSARFSMKEMVELAMEAYSLKSKSRKPAAL